MHLHLPGYTWNDMQQQVCIQLLWYTLKSPLHSSNWLY